MESESADFWQTYLASLEHVSLKPSEPFLGACLRRERC